MSAKGKRRSGFQLFWYLNLFTIVALFLAYLGARVSPVTAWPLAFFSMAYPYILLANVLFIIWWMFRRKKRRAMFSLLAIMLGWSHLGNFIQFRPWGGPSTPEDAQAIKVMSYNVRLFDLYNWTHNKQTRNKIYDMLVEEAPDVLCLQEFFHAPGQTFFVTKDTLQQHLGWPYCYDSYTQRTKRDHYFGIATFSKYPIVGQGLIELSTIDNNLCIWVDLEIGNDTLRVYNAHMASIRFGGEDYRFMKDLENGDQTPPLAEGGKRIAGRLKNAFQKRAWQAEKIAEHIRTSPRPTVYCGDLNDTPNSYSYAQLSAVLQDAFKVSGHGIGNTYVGEFPSFRIDHIMHSQDVKSWDFSTLDVEFSDHHPVGCMIAVSK